ncbi:MAG TPA: CPBP family intramembrane glutamic endopeptidase [Gemmataceae bacterium]|nr:CPBP family intramembrane glutamic endopeptidase [Gemmataceae bacterium]
MSIDRPDDTDDLPTLRPLPPEEREALERDYGEPPPDERDGQRRDFREPPPRRRPRFGFWLAVLWSLLYFVATQVVFGVVFAILIYGIALIPEFREHGMDALDPDRLNAWLQTPPAHVATLCIVGASQVAGLGLSWLLLRLVIGRAWKRKVALTRGPTLTHWVLVLIGMPALLALGAVVEIPIRRYVPALPDVLKRLGLPDLGPEGTTEMIAKLISDTPWVLALFVIGVTPAVCEEVFCRGYLAAGLSGRYRAWAVVLIVSFLFGCLHGDPQQGLGAMCLGTAIHGTFIATRSLWAAMFVHWANNSIAVVHFHPRLFPVLDPYEQALEKAPLPIPILFAVTAILLFAAVAYALYQTRCKLVSFDPARPAWRPEGVSSVELPPPDSGTVVTHDPISSVSVGLVLIAAAAFGVVLAFA